MHSFIENRAARLVGIAAGLVIIAAGLKLAAPILAPVTFALFAIAIVWPLQKTLQRVLPGVAALGITLVATSLVLGAFGIMVSWGLAQVVQWLIANTGRFQLLYSRGTQLLEYYGVFIDGVIANRFDVSWIVGMLRVLSVQLNGMVGFSLLVFIFLVLGLLEVRVFAQRLEANGANTAATIGRIAAKFRRYLLIRTIASVLTGASIWVFTLYMGLELAVAWGVIGFALNFIPFIGPAIAMVLPMCLAIVQFESVAVIVGIFAGLSVIQFIIGSYLEPRLAGAALSISPFLVLFSVFFWSFLWGISGAFIGVPIVIALLTFAEANPSLRWIAELLSGTEQSGISSDAT
ncbi:AI-2E family transporter [Aureimonas fodinaquatilis]|uniref:AI-2E family transporter n=1 Tax=Aureimonas fodinaquatilis TaxID=2565783 RepID=A0A5B0E0V3_9HYPH|nr:AI-2E family transporter [Aureimonas fodinaquatilis]KAA0971932.1 AI-2E family transporter [Aureimonas fodinaquatilis]